MGAEATMTSCLHHGLRLISLWVVWLLAMLLHMDLGLLPLNHRQQPQIQIHNNLEQEIPP